MLELEYFISEEDNTSGYIREWTKVRCISDLCTDTEKDWIFDLDFLICEPVDCKFSILKKNFLSDLSFIKAHNSKESKIFSESYSNIFVISLYKFLSENISKKSENSWPMHFK